MGHTSVSRSWMDACKFDSAAVRKRKVASGRFRSDCGLQGLDDLLLGQFLHERGAKPSRVVLGAYQVVVRHAAE